MRPKYKLDKRQKEFARKQKQERKKLEKLERKNPPAAPSGTGEDPPAT